MITAGRSAVRTSARIDSIVVGAVLLNLAFGFFWHPQSNRSRNRSFRPVAYGFDCGLAGRLCGVEHVPRRYLDLCSASSGRAPAARRCRVSPNLVWKHRGGYSRDEPGHLLTESTSL